MDFFPAVKNTTAQYLFEKSATYFDGELVPKRAHALLPGAKLVWLELKFRELLILLSEVMKWKADNSQHIYSSWYVYNVWEGS